MLRSFLINMNIGNVIHYSVWFCKGLCFSLFSSMFIMFIVKVCLSQKHKAQNAYTVFLKNL